jgi:hypothetical protein
LAVGKKEGGGKDDGATVNGLLIFIEGISSVIAEKQLINYLLKIDIGDEHRRAGRRHLP